MTQDIKLYCCLRRRLPDYEDRTIDLPLDASWSLSGAYGRFNRDTARGWSIAATLQIFDDAEVDQTSQGVRFAGEFDDY